jgi:hypothetical protein
MLFLIFISVENQVYRNMWVHGNEYIEECRKAQLAAQEPEQAAPELEHAAPQMSPPPPPAAATTRKQQPVHQTHVPQIAFHPTAQFVDAQGDVSRMTCSQPPSEHHTLKFPPFPTEPGASLAEWKEQVKLTTFMIHYAEYFRMINKK